MAEIDVLENDVNNLSDGNADTTFRSVFRGIKTAFLKARSENEVGRLRTILSTYRNSIPPRDTLNNVRNSARVMDEELTMMSLDKIFGSINSRNSSLTDLRSKLQKEIDKANDDENLLSQIKSRVDGATTVITGVGELIDDLQDTNADIIETIRNLISKINDISRVFDPDAA